MVRIKRALSDRPRFTVVRHVRNPKELSERDGGSEDAVAKVMADKDVIGRLVDVTGVGNCVKRVEVLVERGGQIALSRSRPSTSSSRAA